MKNVLKDRCLWFDGTIEVPSNTVTTFVTNYPNINLCVDTLTHDIEQYNRFVNKEKRIYVKENNNIPEIDWNLQDRDKIDVKQYVIEKLENEIVCNQKHFSHVDIHNRTKRVLHEMKIFEQHKLYDLLRVLIYIINTLEAQNQVWGVGRGSSVSSYVLYLIGVHDVDSVHYNINFTDFIQE